MNSKSTWNWIILAAALFAFIFFFESRTRKTRPGPVLVLPGLNVTNVSAVQINPAGQLEIRAVHTNGSWQLVRPVNYPAQTLAIEALLGALERLSPVTHISNRELRERPQFDQEYGFNTPSCTIILEAGGQNSRVLIGSFTAPGDQVFLKVVGGDGVFVVGKDFLQFLPRSGDDWRDTSLLDLRTISFDQINVQSGDLTVTFQQNATNNSWRMTHPLQARADNLKLLERLQMLQALRVVRFVTDDPRADLDAFGLRPPELELTFNKGSNRLASLQFGRATTNDAQQIYAKREGVDSVVVVTAQPVIPWRARVDEMRDRHFVTYDRELGGIELRGDTEFDIIRSSNMWRIVQETFPVDTGLMNDFVILLGAMQITQFKDAVTEAELEGFGLANPTRTIKLLPVNANGGSETNGGLLLSFGVVDGVNVFGRRSDENSVYALRLEDYVQLPLAAWELRERRLWQFTEADVTRVIIKQDGKTRELIRHGTNSWSFAPGSQGIINEFGVEEAVHRLGQLAATQWVARDQDARAEFGIGSDAWSITLELKNGEKAVVEFGRHSQSGYPYAASSMGGESWIYEFPVAIYQLVSSYLAIPPDAP